MTHGQAAARYVADRVAVLQDGRVVEQDKTEDVIVGPRPPHTRTLLAASRERAIIPEEQPCNVSV